MSTARKIPEHGTYARGNGSPGYREPCHCEPCLNARRIGKKRQRVNRQLGRPTKIDATVAAKKLHQLHEHMGWEQIGAALNTSGAHIREIAAGRRPQIATTTHSKIMALEPEKATGGQYIDATGTIRRIRALTAAGHSLQSIADDAGSTYSRIQLISAGEQQQVRRFMAEGVSRAYSTLSRKSGDSSRSRNRAKALSWAPPGAWDDDTIDDPSAAPEWTGHCGTDRGYWMHRTQHLPMCDGCEQAHQDWRAQHAHLDNITRGRLASKAKAQVSNRGEVLAHDGRELVRQGVPVDQAAARLGVTRQYLQQEMLRHPEQPTQQQLDTAA